MKGFVRRHSVLILVLLVVAVGACDGSTGAQPDASPAAQGVVQPFETILANGPSFAEVGSSSATVLVTTTIPTVCAVAYGTTTAYGHLATDSDMAGGAHQNHHPLLVGLQPDTVYHVRVQGVGSDGTLYQSQDYTFRTSKAAPVQARPSGSNLALMSDGARVVGVSSNYAGGSNSSSFGADNAIDGNPATQWSSNGDGDHAWIEIELARRSNITAIGFWSRTMGSSAEIRSFRVVADGHTSYGPFALSDAAGIHYFPADFVAQRLRFEAVTTTRGNTGAVEIEVYGTPR